MNELVAGVICRNEEHRYLREFIEDLETYCDLIVVLDDASTDNTVSILEEYKKVQVHEMKEPTFWKDESKIRSMLWREILPQYDIEWVLSIDADEFIDPRFKCLKDGVLKADTISDIKANGFNLWIFEYWNSTEKIRVDKLWNILYKSTPCIVRWLPQVNYQWSAGKLHCGRIPLNQPQPILQTPFILKHFGWADNSIHRDKYDKYVGEDLEPHPRMAEHYKSILDKKPELRRLEGCD